MSEATLWTDNTNSTATIAGTNVSYTMPLWAFNVMRDIIGAEAEKKVEVTHRDFDTQQELLDRHKAENAKLRELCRRFAEYASQDRCEGCVCKRRCNNGEIDECWQRTEILEAAHEFGIELAE